MEYKEIREKIVEAGEKAVRELIKVAESKIITDDEGDLSSDKLKNAAAAKKLAIFDAFEIMSRIESEENILKDDNTTKDTSITGFAEKRASGGKR